MGKPKRSRIDEQPELSPGKHRSMLAPEATARIAIARRAKPSPIPGYVRLPLTLEVPRELAEKLSNQAILSGRPRDATRRNRLLNGPRVTT